jgi:nucleoside-diphosphate-sugar epimerase
VGRAAGWDGRVVAVQAERLPDHLKLGIDARQDLVASTERIRSELGYDEIVPAGEALRRTVEWERSNPPVIDPKEYDYDQEDEVLKSLGL